MNKQICEDANVELFLMKFFGCKKISEVKCYYVYDKKVSMKTLKFIY